jgi:hypothetical protein
MKTIQIVIDPRGNSVVETKGFAGADCREASRLLELALGEVVSDRATAEFYQASHALKCPRQEHRVDGLNS